MSSGKLAIIGAGSVGASMAYAALIRESAAEIVLYDIDGARAHAEALDLRHGAPFTGAARVRGGNDLELVRDADVIIVTAGAKQKPGQTRLDLAATNAAILRDLLPKLLDVAPEAVFVLVTNPCDVLTVIAERILDLPAGRVFSSGTVLDSARLHDAIAERAGVDPRSVHASIIGEHGDSEFPLWSHALIGPGPLDAWRDENGAEVFTPEVRAQLHDDVVHAAYRVIEGKGATNFAIGLSGARIAEAIIRDQRAVIPVSSVLTDYHGVSGVALSVPSIVGAHGVERVMPLPLSAWETERFHASAEAVRTAVALIERG